MMARSITAPCKGRIQMRKTNPSICSHSAFLSERFASRRS
jgi:hypothetical protein